MFGAAAIAWIVTVERMRGMDAGPGTDLGASGWYLGVWVTMSAAMMLPSAVPDGRVRGTGLAWAADRCSSRPATSRRGRPTASWPTRFFRLVTSLDLAWLAWDRGGPYATGAVLVVAGLYELTPLKAACLRRCRSVEQEPGDRLSGLRAGLEHGVYCVGASWALMAVLFALGVMSVLWMAIVAAVIFVEKVLPNGVRISRFVAPALIALGLWAAISPSSVPGLTEPDEPAPSMRMEMR